MSRLLALIIAILAVVTPTLTYPQVQMRTQDTPFYEEIRLFGVEDEIYPPQGCETLFVGSSSFRFWFAMHEDFRDLQILRRGFGGARIADINFYFDQIVGRYRPQRIVFYAGENDIDSGLSPEAVMAAFTGFLDRKRAVLGATPVFFVSAKPSIARWAQFERQSRLNQLVERLAEEHDDLIYVDIVGDMLANNEPDPGLYISDGLHMNEAGYRLWRNRLVDAFGHAPASEVNAC